MLILKMIGLLFLYLFSHLGVATLQHFKKGDEAAILSVAAITILVMVVHTAIVFSLL